jgi:purine-nucleoside phosphorylase
MIQTSTKPGSKQVLDATGRIKKAMSWNQSSSPRLGLVLGSGLGEFASSLSERRDLPFSAIPHFPQSTVDGHSGNLVVGRTGDTPIACLQGRIHYYEGHTIKAVTFPVRVLAELGIRYLVVTNAAGGINPRFRAGDLMLIRDHISSFVPNPLIGPNDNDLGPRFPDMSEPYPLRLRRLARRCAGRLRINVKEGVYAAVTGPSYESPAEIRMLKRLGADAVGMSTVPEIIVARLMGLECLGISIITNLAAGISKKRLSHEEVLKVGDQVRPRLIKLLALILQEIAKLKPT